MARYARDLSRFAREVAASHAAVKVFRTTTAAWQKWGNWGYEWPPGQMHDYANSPAFVRALNRAALAVVAREPSLAVIDGFASTHARADHTQHGEKGIAGHMVHHGPDIQELHNRVLLLMILRRLCPRTLRHCRQYSDD